MVITSERCNPQTRNCSTFCGEAEQVARRLGLLRADGTAVSPALGGLLGKLTDVIAASERAEALLPKEGNIRQDFDAISTAATVCRWVARVLNHPGHYGRAGAADDGNGEWS